MNFTSNKINPAVWGTYIVLLMLPELLMLNTKTWWDAPVAIVFNILFYGVFAWLLCGLASLTGRRTERALHVALQAVMAAYSLSNGTPIPGSSSARPTDAKAPSSFLPTSSRSPLSLSSRYTWHCSWRRLWWGAV